MRITADVDIMNFSVMMQYLLGDKVSGFYKKVKIFLGLKKAERTKDD